MKLNLDKNSPIGVFDSGIGGISVVNTIKNILPNEDIVYFGDTINAPYGIKTKKEVRKLTSKAVDFLLEKNVKIIIIACNTATSASIQFLRENHKIQLIGMEPALSLAVRKEKKDIAVFATELTLKEKKFESLTKKFEEDVNIYKVPANELVMYVESKDKPDINYHDFSKIVDSICPKEVRDEVDSVVLGCTHYVFLKDYFQKYFCENVKIIDGNSGTVRHLKNTLEKLELLNEKDEQGKIEIYTSQQDLKERMISYVDA